MDFFDFAHFLRLFKLIKTLPKWQQGCWFSLFSTVFLLGIANFAVLVMSAPHEWDALSYHIARVAYYLQHGNLEPFPTNYWAQTVHPKVCAVLNGYLFMATGRNENMFQLLQYSSYWIAILAVYGTAARLFGRRSIACFIGLSFGLIIEILLQATTPLNDLFLTALAACILLFMVELRANPQMPLFLMCGTAFGLGLGSKATFLLVMPSLGLIGLWGLSQFFSSTQNKQAYIQRALRMAGILLLPFLLICLPSGYLDNLALYGHPLGPKEVRIKHTYATSNARTVLQDGTKNLLRYGMEFLSLECPFPFYTVTRVNNAMRRVAQKAIETCGINLMSGERLRAEFVYIKEFVAHEATSYWGALGFGLVIPLLFSIFFQPGKHKSLFVFATASWLFIFLQAFCGPYDPWRGRYFIQLAPLAIPLIAVAWKTKRPIAKYYLATIVVIACMTAICAITFRPKRSLVSLKFHLFKTKSVFQQARLDQLTANRAWFLDDLRNYEATVPSSAIVGVRFPDNNYEYLLFGKGLTRTIIPFPGGQHIKTNVDFVVYCKGRDTTKKYDSYKDLDFDERWVVRKLHARETAIHAFDAIAAEHAQQHEN